ncbi:hypothetical protein [Cellulomonas hominis]
MDTDPVEPRPDTRRHRRDTGRRWRRMAWITAGLFVGYVALMVWALSAYGRQFE